jgi:NADH-quinone oxidoreductase subunit G
VNEEWISDKTRYAVDGLKRQRLDMPMARGPSGNLEPISWKAALELASSKLIATPGAKMAALAGPLVEVEALIIQAALSRHESRGLHFTLDYPETLKEAVDTVLVP